VNKLGLKKVDKEYYVQVDGMITQEAIDQMKMVLKWGLMVGSIKQKCEARLINKF
jgi:23S rRNA pseudouridine2457 synthase